MKCFHYKKGDFLLLGFLLSVSISVILFTKLKSKSGDLIYIYTGEKHVEIHKLTVDKEIGVSGKLGTTWIHIDSGVVSIQKSPCPYHFCEKSGPISRAGQMLVCVPNQVIVKVVGKASDSLDALTQ